MTRTTLRRLLPVLGILTLAACGGNMASGDREHVAAMAREHAHDAPIASGATLPAPAQDVVAREVEYATVDGQPVRGYLARPAAARGALPGVVMIHEWWGLNDNIRTMARRLAGEGYAVLAVDLYGGRSAESPEQARELTTSVMQNPAPAEENLRGAAEYLAREQHAGKIGIVGWCFGGGWSLRGALAVPQRIDAVVVYYGQPITEPERLAPLDAPLLGLFGAEDRGIPVEQVRAMEAALRTLGKDVTIQVYPGAAHAFANPSGTAYDAEAAEDAWARTLAFFGRHLGG